MIQNSNYNHQNGYQQNNNFNPSYHQTEVNSSDNENYYDECYDNYENTNDFINALMGLRNDININDDYAEELYIPSAYTSKLSKAEILDLLLSSFLEDYKFLNCNGILLIYDFSKGYYLPLQKQEFEVFVKKHTGNHFGDQFIHKISKTVAAELYTTLLSKSNEFKYEEMQEATSDFINFSDCVYCISTGTFLDPKPDLPYLNCINISLNQNRNVSPQNFLNFLNQISCGDSEVQAMLIQLGGYLLTDKNSIKSGFFLIGPTNTGKSTFISLIIKIIGSNNISSVPLHELSGFNTMNLFGMKANMVSELKDEEISDIQFIKNLRVEVIILTEPKNIKTQ